MFCSKCGKDCGEFRFCPHCGTQVSQAEEAPASWSVGMACPHCGGVELEGDKCAFCGAVLKMEQIKSAENEDSFEMPFSWVRTYNYHVQLAKETMVITRERFVLGQQYTVRYNQLIEVKYVGEKKLRSQLHIRWRTQRKEIEKSFCLLNAEIISSFFLLFFLLKQLAPPTTDFRMELPIVDEATMGSEYGSIDWDDYFQRFCPYRDRAVEALCREYAVPKKQAEIMVRAAFESRQLRLYEENPALAIRDANRFLKDRERRIEEKIKEYDKAIVSHN